MSLSRRLCTAASLASLAASLLSPPGLRGGQRAPVRFEVVFTGDVSGYLEPCG